MLHNNFRARQLGNFAVTSGQTALPVSILFALDNRTRELIRKPSQATSSTQSAERKLAAEIDKEATSYRPIPSDTPELIQHMVDRGYDANAETWLA